MEMLQQQTENKFCKRSLSLSLCFPCFSLTHSFSLSPSACTHKFQLTILPLIWQKQQKVTKQPLPLSAKLQFEILAPLPPKTPTKQAHLPISYTHPPLAPSHSLSLSLSASLIRRLTMPIWQSLSSINYDYRHVLWDVCPTLWLTQGVQHSYNEYWQRIYAIYTNYVQTYIQSSRWGCTIRHR